MKAAVTPSLPNSTRLLVNGYAHLNADGRPECGRDDDGMKPMTLAQAIVYVRPMWCHRCFAHWIGGGR